MAFLYANRLKLCMRIDLMSAIRTVGETTSMYAACRRIDLDVCESTELPTLLKCVRETDYELQYSESYPASRQK